MHEVTGRPSKPSWAPPLPNDYKAFISTYGSGSVNGLLSIWSPFAKDDARNLFRQVDLSRVDAEEVQARYAALKRPTALLYSLLVRTCWRSAAAVQAVQAPPPHHRQRRGRPELMAWSGCDPG